MQGDNTWSVLAGSALNHWRSNKYAESVEILKKLREQLETNPDAVSPSASAEKPSGDGVEDPEAANQNKEQSLLITEAKIKHNIALADFAAKNDANMSTNGDSNLEDIDSDLNELLKTLSQVEDSIRTTAKTLGEVEKEKEIENDNEGESTKESPAEKEKGSSDSASGENAIANTATETGTLNSNINGFELDATLVLYNQAVVLVYRHQYRSAMKILEGLFRYIEAVDENVALCICFLLLDIYSQIRTNSDVAFEQHQENSDDNNTNSTTGNKGNTVVARVIDKAQQVIDYLEKPHIFNGRAGADEGDGDGADEENGENEDGQEKLSASRDVAEFRFRLHMYKAKLRALEGHVKGSRKEVKTALEIFQHELKSSKDTTGLWLGYQLGVDTTVETGESKLDKDFNTPALCLKANLEYLRANHRKSIKLLQSCSKAGLDKGIFFNNMGCIHHTLGQHRCASMYFARSLDMYQKDSGESGGKKRQRNSKNISSQPCVYNVLLNTGVQLLHTGRPRIAYSCFQEAALTNYHRPRLWMYIAECICMAHEQALNHKAAFDSTNPNSVSSRRLVEGSVGEGLNHRYYLDISGSGRESDEWTQKVMFDSQCPAEMLPGSSEQMDQVKRNQERNSESGMFELSPLSLEAGLRATSNALYLLDEAKPGIGFMASMKRTQDFNTNSTTSSKVDALAAGDDSDNEESKTDKNLSAQASLLVIGQTTLLCRAYLSLCVKDWTLALEAASQALELLDVSPVKNSENMSIANTYMAEAYFRTGKREQGLEHALKALDIQDEYANSSPKDPSDFKSLRCAMCVNVGAARLASGDTLEAIHSIQKALQYLPHSREAIRMLLYIYIKQNQVEKALDLLKRFR